MTEIWFYVAGFMQGVGCGLALFALGMMIWGMRAK